MAIFSQKDKKLFFYFSIYIELIINKECQLKNI